MHRQSRFTPLLLVLALVCAGLLACSQGDSEDPPGETARGASGQSSDSPGHSGATRAPAVSGRRIVAVHRELVANTPDVDDPVGVPGESQFFA